MSNRGSALAERIRKLQVRVVRTLNNHHIFVNQAIPVLQRARAEYENADDSTDRKYFVPSHAKRGVARRNDAELKKIYDAFLSRDLFATTLIAAVSVFESFLSETLQATLRAYPKKLALGIGGAAAEPHVDISVVLSAKDLDGLIESLIARRLRSVFYASPRAYLQYVRAVTGIAVKDAAFQKYVEIKATRDLLVHNSGVVNDLYLEKVGRSRRAEIDEEIPLTQAYFDDSLAALKRIANIMQKETFQVFAR